MHIQASLMALIPHSTLAWAGHLLQLMPKLIGVTMQCTFSKWSVWQPNKLATGNDQVMKLQWLVRIQSPNVI